MDHRTVPSRHGGGECDPPPWLGCECRSWRTPGRTVPGAAAAAEAAYPRSAGNTSHGTPRWPDALAQAYAGRTIRPVSGLDILDAGTASAVCVPWAITSTELCKTKSRSQQPRISAHQIARCTAVVWGSIRIIRLFRRQMGQIRYPSLTVNSLPRSGGTFNAFCIFLFPPTD